MDDVARDLSLAIRDGNSPRGQSAAGAFAWTLLAVSPHSAFARATLIDKDADRVKDRLAQWEKESADSPGVIGVLARRAVAQERTDDAGRLLERYVRLSPDAWAFEALAKIYKDRGDRERWKAALDEFLEAPDETGLEHARIRVEIANDLMDRQQWKDAWPYAEAAAATWAAWAMRPAQRCAEGMGDLDTAELWYRREAERYPHSWAVWFMFCKRTGHGDVEAARALAEQVLQMLGDRPDVSRPEIVQSDWLGFYYWLTDRPGKALDPLRRAYQSKPGPPECTYPLLVADQVGDRAARDECLQTFRDRHGTQSPKSRQVLDLLFSKDAAGGAPSPDLKAIDAILESIRPEIRGNTAFPVGVFLANHARPELARKYLRMGTEGARTGPWIRVVAANLLQRIDQKPGPKQ